MDFSLVVVSGSHNKTDVFFNILGLCLSSLQCPALALLTLCLSNKAAELYNLEEVERKKARGGGMIDHLLQVVLIYTSTESSFDVSPSLPLLIPPSYFV